MSSSMYAEWQDFLMDEPALTGQLFDRQMAQLSAMYYNRHRPQSADSLDMTEFCMLAANRPPPQTAEQMFQMMKGVKSVQNSRPDLHAEGEC
jgi:hypothetical protein